ncbi:MAG: hypothetical protein D6689_03175 [Deltaproteobacteria bacterium]|nr:MAG: hypothetical protein D6689_03175 [Deltaproteobacteria bacterium]
MPKIAPTVAVVAAYLAGCTVGGSPSGMAADAGATAPDAFAPDAFAPDASSFDGGLAPCEPIGGATYATLSTAGPVSDRPASEHPDLNIKLRGWSATGGATGLIDLDGPTDPRAPQLATVFADDRVPAFAANYRVNDWDWQAGEPAGPISAWEVTMVAMATTPGELIEVPVSGYDIGDGFQVRVLYADDDSITLKYTREDNVVSGYALHVVGVCVDPALRDLYATSDAAGRAELPALRADQAFGRARSSRLLVAIRDTGQFMDPRSRKDWWQGR